MSEPNKERLEELAVILENAKYFDMDQYHTCGSPSCIIGYASAHAGLAADNWTDEAVAEFYNISEDTVMAIALPGSHAARKFYLNDSEKAMNYAAIAFEIDNIQAAKVIRHFAETGEIDHLIGMDDKRP